MQTRSLLIAAALTFFFSAPTVICLAPSHAMAADSDCDGLDDSTDNCVAKYNPDQSDLDGDSTGDRCDADKDGDAVANDIDNCPKDANGGQEDADTDGVGDSCDQCAEDAGGAVVNRRGCSIEQICPCSGPDDDSLWRSHDKYFRCVKRVTRKFRIHALINSDERSIILDEAKANSCGVPVPVAGDNDGDGIDDAGDNCPSDSNPGQKNSDGDSFGDACDADKDNDNVLNADDNCPIVANSGAGQSADADNDTVGDACDACSETAGGIVDRDGCSIAQACPCALDEDGTPWASHGRYVRCVKDEVFRFRQIHLLTAEQADTLRADAVAATCGNRPPVCE